MPKIVGSTMDEVEINGHQAHNAVTGRYHEERKSGSKDQIIRGKGDSVSKTPL